MKIGVGISDFARIVKDKYIYVDKTSFIEKLEDYLYSAFFRPRRFGKSLLVSTLANYYDVKKKSEFSSLFARTYIGDNPTKNRNSYCILHFDFSSISWSDSIPDAIHNAVYEEAQRFLDAYDNGIKMDNMLSSPQMIDRIFTVHKGEPIYVFIDEYDKFANTAIGEILASLREIIKAGGYFRCFFEKLKFGTRLGKIHRIFITGISPLVMDSLTSGFNISTDLSRRIIFNEMVGFTHSETKSALLKLGKSENEVGALMATLSQKCNGYRFSISAPETLFNSGLLFENLVNQSGDVDVDFSKNALSDFETLKRIFSLVKPVSSLIKPVSSFAPSANSNEREELRKVIERLLNGHPIKMPLNRVFMLHDFSFRDLCSLLFYMGYLTPSKDEFGLPQLTIPNSVIEKILRSYFPILFA
ncbi:MAG: AAA family ATPase [Clostridiales bacterium]|nr:AAA family ATPase [Clostridiales bacterium]